MRILYGLVVLVGLVTGNGVLCLAAWFYYTAGKNRDDNFLLAISAALAAVALVGAVHAVRFVSQGVRR